MAKRIRWSYELAVDVVSKYKTLKEFKKDYAGLYTTIRSKGWLHILDGLEKRVIGRTLEDCERSAKKCKTMGEFKELDNSAYQRAYKQKWIKQICSHMSEYNKPTTLAKVKSEAKKYNTKNDFLNGSPREYRFAHKHNIIADVCSHMESGLLTYTDEEAIQEAKRYCTRSDLMRGSEWAYDVIRSRGLQIVAYMHMVDGSRTDADVVYVWRIPNTNIVKIGVTSERLGDTRIKYVARDMKVDYEILGMFYTEDAYDVEKHLHNTYKIVPTTLPKRGGHTEFRIMSASNVNEVLNYLEEVVETVTLVCEYQGTD